jgi:arylsulfatase A-like enzyme
MDRVLPFIDRAVKRQQPFLSVVWFHTPHLPVITGEKYKNIYKGLTEDQKNFYGCITAMDEQVGRLRDHLKKLNIDKNTLIFFASDNGPEGKDDTQRHAGQTYGLDGRKRSLKEGGIRVPGIMVWPGKIQKGRVINTPVYTSDYFPTIASILDIDIHKYKRPCDGVDIMQIIEFENGAVPKDRFLPFLLEDQAALIGNRYKIYKKDKTADWQLFDLLNDPNETTNISEEHMEIIEELKEKWATWKTSVDDSAKGNDY